MRGSEEGRLRSGPHLRRPGPCRRSQQRHHPDARELDKKHDKQVSNLDAALFFFAASKKLVLVVVDVLFRWNERSWHAHVDHVVPVDAFEVGMTTNLFGVLKTLLRVAVEQTAQKIFGGTVARGRNVQRGLENLLVPANGQ